MGVFSHLALPDWLGVLELPVLGRLCLSLVLGAAIGLERQVSHKAAGLRTNMLICLGATLLTEASLLVTSESFVAGPWVRSDPARIVAQIVSGIGFIGAGTIIVLRGNVVGLTTAATLWVVAGVGVAVGLRAYVVAVGATLLVLVTLAVLRRVEDALPGGERRGVLRITIAGPPRVDRVERLLADSGLRVRRIGFERAAESCTITCRVRGKSGLEDDLVRSLGMLEEVTGVHLE